jgi:hypothetical protein
MFNEVEKMNLFNRSIGKEFKEKCKKLMQDELKKEHPDQPRALRQLDEEFKNQLFKKYGIDENKYLVAFSLIYRDSDNYEAVEDKFKELMEEKK